MTVATITARRVRGLAPPKSALPPALMLSPAQRGQVTLALKLDMQLFEEIAVLLPRDVAARIAQRRDANRTLLRNVLGVLP